MMVTVKQLVKLGFILVCVGLFGWIGCGEESPDEHAGHDHSAVEGQTKQQIKIPKAVMDSLRLKKKRYEVSRDAYWDDKGGVLENSFLELWYPPGPVTVTHGMHAFEQIFFARTKCRTFFGIVPAAKLKVVCAPEMEDYTKMTGRDWWQYSKIEKNQITYQPVYILHQRNLGEVAIQHEFVEWAIGQLSDGRAPRWLEEGLASHLSGEAILLANQLTEFKDQPLEMTFEQIEKQLAKEKDRVLTRIAYYHAYRMVETLISRQGESKLKNLVLKMRDDLDVNNACLIVFEKSYDEVLTEAMDYKIPELQKPIQVKE